MKQMIKENELTFQSLEKDIYRFICEFGQDITKQNLETYDQRPKKGRNKSFDRNKGLRTTTNKTIYGEVTHQTVYETYDEYRQRWFVSETISDLHQKVYKILKKALLSVNR